MATPRVTIDQLPEQAIPEDGNYFVVQDSGVSKKMSWATIKTQPSQPLTDHIADTDDAHDASAISATAAGTGVDGANVQAQLGQLATLVNGKISQSVADGLYVNLTGDTMTGPLILVTDPTGALEAATKQYVDAKVIESGGGISMGDADLRYVNVTGDAMSGALTVDALISTNTGLVLPAGEPSAADRAARRDYVDTAVSNRVAKAGDTMTGPLAIRPTTAGYSLRLQNTAADPYLSLATPDGTQRYGQLVGGPTQVKLLAEQGDIHLQTLSGAAILSGQTDMKLSLADVAGRAINGWFGFRNPIILPGGYGASDLQGLLCGKGFRIEVGNEASTGLLVTNTGFTRHSFFNDGRADHYGPARIGNSSVQASLSLIGSSSGPIISFYDGTDPANLGNRRAYIGTTSDVALVVHNDTTGGNTYMDSGAGGVVSFRTATTERARFDSTGNFLHGKTATNQADTGIELLTTGSVQATRGDAGAPYICNKVAPASASPMFVFRLDGTQVGSIARNGTTAGVVYNQTSDKRLKDQTRPADNDELLTTLLNIEPVHFTWKAYPDAGEQLGFFAQDVAEHIPAAITPGEGEPGDEEFIPWGMDNAQLVPYLVAAVKSLAQRVAQLEGAAA